LTTPDGQVRQPTGSEYDRRESKAIVVPGLRSMLGGGLELN
jgi:hypothetical protein